MERIIPSVFNANLVMLKEALQFFEENQIEIIHVDMMDGNYVPNIAFGPDQIRQIRQNTTLKIDVHMMVKDPQKLIPEVIAAGADMISIHYESTPHIHEAVKMIKDKNVKVGVALNPATPESVLTYLLDDLDFILLMSINPGYFKQTFIEQIYSKIAATKQLIGDRKIQIEIDGRMNPERIPRALKAGASLFVVGSYLFENDKEVRIKQLKNSEGIK